MVVAARVVLVATLLSLSGSGLSASARPNIVLILADDVGYNDVPWHNSDIKAPHLEALSRDGITLELSYADPTCTASRSSLMTGYHVTHTGRHLNPIAPDDPVGLQVNLQLMPQYLNDLGYQSHALGKWHLGSCNEAYLPTRRGFQSFYGFLNGATHPFEHTVADMGVFDFGAAYDFWDNEQVDWSARGQYDVDLFANRASAIIRNHTMVSPDAPLFMYLAAPQAHIPLVTPKRYLDMYPDEKNNARRAFSAMMSSLDDLVGKVVQDLKDTNMYENTIILFSSDNGGWIAGGGNNYPLRGEKGTFFEGGTRVPGFIHAPFLNKAGFEYRGLLHMTDWLPTLYSAAGGDASTLPMGEMDGINQWQYIIDNKPSKRGELLYGLRPREDLLSNQRGASFRIGDMKLIRFESGRSDDWVPPEHVWNVDDPQYHLNFTSSSLYKCPVKPTPMYQLYNLLTDPYETTNIFGRMGDFPAVMIRRLEKLEENMAEVDEPKSDNDGLVVGKSIDPNGAVATNWCQPKYH